MKKHVQNRIARNRQIAAVDASRRCVICKQDLALSPQVVEDFLVPGKCCSDMCLEELLARDRAKP